MNDCIVKMPDLLQKSAELGYSGVAITDHDCLSSAVKALEYVQDIKQNYPNFKLVLGNEIYLNEEQPIDEIPKFYHFLLLARTEKGFEYLKQLSTRAWYRGKVVRGILRVPTFYSDIEEIVQTKGDLVASSACLGSFLASCITQYIEEGSIEARNKAISFVNWGKKVFGEEYFYIEIQSSINEEQVAYNKKALQLAKLMNVKVILTEDVHYLVKEDKNIHKAFVDSTRSSNNEDDNTKDFYEGCYLKPEDELRERLSYLSDEQFREVCQNTVNILDTVEEYSIKQNTIVPLRKLPEFSVQGLFEQWYSDYPSIEYCAHSEYDQDRFLLSEIEKGFLDRKQELNQVNIKRINDELDVVLHISEELGQRLSAYYNLMQVILNIIWEKGDSLVGIARGSATAFYILYLIGVTQINPIIYNLPYFRHLNYARAGAMAD